jgi:hypothetical protein
VALVIIIMPADDPSPAIDYHLLAEELHALAGAAVPAAVPPGDAVAGAVSAVSVKRGSMTMIFAPCFSLASRISAHSDGFVRAEFSPQITIRLVW